MSQTINTSEALQDIEELGSKIEQFKSGGIPAERFKAFRLTRGVYGQRQPDVQMLRIKVPYGKISPEQLRTIANISERFTNGNLHITTRQDIQLHYIHLEDTPEIWHILESAGITTREACGNTVRNVTASPFAGIDPDEPFDVSPYAKAVFEYFLRNPVCQDMGRKIKIAFSSSESDSAFAYIHDFGFIPRIADGIEGFKVLVGGGLGAQAVMAQVAYDFIPGEKVIPIIEAGLRVFDRYGERERRHKARLKFLLDPKKGLGLDGFLRLVEDEQRALPYHAFPISKTAENIPIPTFNQLSRLPIRDLKAFEQWKAINVFEQKQKGYFAVKLRIPLGNLNAESTRQLARIIDRYAAEDVRLTVNQGMVLKYLRYENLPNLFTEMEALGLSDPGFDSLVDITACPGTDTCNLGVTNSTAISTVLENMVRNEYPHLIAEDQIKIKISGCMNSCGQHMIANIGFHGSSIKQGQKVIPAMQVVIGGGVDADGKGFIADKVIKLPTKRIPDVVRFLLDDYETHSSAEEYFNRYYLRRGKMYFYELLKPLADSSTLSNEDFQDWGAQVEFAPEIGVGECAGIVLDLVGTILKDAEDRLDHAKGALGRNQWAHSIYWSYNAMVIGAKGFLLSQDIQCNTQKGIIDNFRDYIFKEAPIDLDIPFDELVLQINQNAPEEEFAFWYFMQSQEILRKIISLRKSGQLKLDDKLVVSNFYRA